VLKRIFWPEWAEVMGEWRKLHNEEMCNLYALPSVIRMMKSRRKRWAGHVAQMVERRNAYRLLVGKPKGRRQLGRQRCRSMDNIKMDLGDRRIDRIGLVKDKDKWRALVNAVMNLLVP
jgi:hypothetical protein